MGLPVYIPLDEAVRRYRIDREALTQQKGLGIYKPLPAAHSLYDSAR